MATKRYVDSLQIHLREYEGYALPENFREETLIEVDVHDFVKRDAIVDQLERSIRPQAFELEDRWTHFSWGADSASLVIVISSAVGGLAAAIKIAEKLARHLGKPRQIRAEEAPKRVRALLADSLRVPEEALAVEGVERLPSGFRLEVTTADHRRFVAELDEKGSLHRLKRT